MTTVLSEILQKSAKWKEVSLGDRVYYWDSLTNETTWKKPPEMRLKPPFSAEEKILFYSSEAFLVVDSETFRVDSLKGKAVDVEIEKQRTKISSYVMHFSKLNAKASFSQNQINIPILFWLTSYRIFILPQDYLFYGVEYISVPYPTISSFEGSREMVLNVKAFPFVEIIVKFHNTSEFDEATNTLKTRDSEDYFCLKLSQPTSTWFVFPREDDFFRKELNVDPAKWNLLQVNQLSDFTHYPNFWYFPKALRVDDIKKSAKYRKGSYYPLPLYVKNNSVLLSCWRPQHKNVLSEYPDLLEYRAINSFMTNKWIIFDVGPKKVLNIEAWSEILFYNFPDENRIQKLWTDLGEHLCSPLKGNHDVFFPSNDYQSGWIQTIQALLSVAYKVTSLFYKGTSLLIQGYKKNQTHRILLSLSQILLDPFYRTIEGLCRLIEKDWIGIPYDFSLKNRKSSYVPYFELFLNSLFYLIAEFPASFEYSVGLVDYLFKESHSFRFGTFLHPIRKDIKTAAIWEYIQSHRYYFQNNQFKNNPSVLSPSFSLKFKYIWPALLNGIPHVQSLEVSSYIDSISLNAHSANICDNLTSLQLVNLKLPFIPEYVLGMLNLETLNLSSNEITSIPPSLVKLRNLIELDFSHNPLQEISTAFMDYITEALPKFTTFILNESNILSFSLGSLKNFLLNRSIIEDRNEFLGGNLLNIFECKESKLPKVPKFIQNFINLTKIDLGFNNLTSIQPMMVLTKLREMILENNKLVTLPDQISALENLTKVNLANNELESLPISFSKLSKITYLRLEHNNLGKSLDTTIHSIPVHLKFLSIARNSIKKLPLQIGKFSEMEILDFSHNSISQIPISILELKEIRKLFLNNNMITALPANIGLLGKLREIDLSSNKLSVLPHSLGYLSLSNFKWEFNPELEKILSEEVKQKTQTEGFKPILEFLQQVITEDKRTFRSKILVLGEEGVGKTSLVALLRNKFNSSDSSVSLVDKSTISRTQGIDISSTVLLTDNTNRKFSRKLPPEKIMVDVSFWDFAGSESLQSTFQYFLTGSIFIILWDATKDDSKVTKWIHEIACKNQKPIVFLVGTHIDLWADDIYHPRVENVCKKMIEEKKMKYRLLFPSISFHIFGISLASLLNCNDFEKALRKKILLGPSMGIKVPYTFLLLEQYVIEERAKYFPPIISRVEWLDIGRICGIKTEEDILEASSILHMFGTIIHFQNDTKLQEIVVLDPQWLINMMVDLKNSATMHSVNGLMHHNVTSHLWKHYPESSHEYLMDILRKFEMIHEISSDVSKDAKLIDKLKQEASNPNKEIPESLARSSPNFDTRVSSIFSVSRWKWNTNGVSLLPSLLESLPPDKIRQLWPNRCNQNFEFNRCIQFKYIPCGLMSRLMVRVLTLFTPDSSKEYTIWKDGVYLERDVLITAHIYPDKSLCYMGVRGNNSVQAGQAFVNLIEIVYHLLFEWPNLQTERYIACGSCKKNNRAQPGKFKLDEIELKSIQGINSATCPECKAVLNLEQIAPDLQMVYFQGSKISAKEFKMGDQIGQGGFASVYKGTYKGKPVAIKKLEFSVDSDSVAFTKAFNEFRREIYIMSSFVNDYSVKLHAICLDPFSLIEELCVHGDLYTLLHENDEFYLSWKMRIKMAQNIAAGMYALHKSVPPVAHLDLKSPNILVCSLDENDAVCVKISDFGISSQGAFQYIRHTDNPVWLAPEVIQGQIYDASVDVYSFGVILYEILTREFYFKEFSFSSDISEAVTKGKRPVIPAKCIPKYKELIESCWQQSANKRPKFGVLLEQFEALSQEVDIYKVIAKLCLYLAGLMKTSSTNALSKPLVRDAQKKYEEFENEVSLSASDFYSPAEIEQFPPVESLYRNSDLNHQLNLDPSFIKSLSPRNSAYLDAILTGIKELTVQYTTAIEGTSLRPPTTSISQLFNDKPRPPPRNLSEFRKENVRKAASKAGFDGQSRAYRNSQHPAAYTIEEVQYDPVRDTQGEASVSVPTPEATPSPPETPVDRASKRVSAGVLASYDSETRPLPPLLGTVKFTRTTTSSAFKTSIRPSPGSPQRPSGKSPHARTMPSIEQVPITISASRESRNRTPAAVEPRPSGSKNKTPDAVDSSPESKNITPDPVEPRASRPPNRPLPARPSNLAASQPAIPKLPKEDAITDEEIFIRNSTKLKFFTKVDCISLMDNIKSLLKQFITKLSNINSAPKNINSVVSTSRVLTMAGNCLSSIKYPEGCKMESTLLSISKDLLDIQQKVDLYVGNPNDVEANSSLSKFSNSLLSQISSLDWTTFPHGTFKRQ